MIELMQKLISLSEDMARGSYARHLELFELTKSGNYPDDVVRLAEAFGMMMVKVESREFHLAQIIEELQKSQADLARAQQELSRENQVLRKTIRENFATDRILGKSAVLQEVKETIRRIAGTAISVLITGETGTGKDLIAQSIHYGSSRAERPFVAVNCSAIPEGMLEAELFGIEKGVATGVDRRIGKIEQSSGGTLFLDEIGEMPLNAQAKVLRAIEGNTVERVGGRAGIPVDIRLVAATNRNLAEEVRKGTFRQDLYYRLNVVQIVSPPLRERRDDIPLLLAEFLKQGALSAGRSALRFEPGLLARLQEYPWPGNVRQLKNEVERAIALACSDTIGMADLSGEIRMHFAGAVGASCESGESPKDLRESELRTIRAVLRETGGNRSDAARQLGISREGLRKKLKRYGIDADNT